MYLARAFEGFFASAILPPALALMAELSPKDKRGKYMGLLGASQTAGIIIGPLIGGLLFEGFTIGGFRVIGSIALPFYASAGMGFFSLIWSYYQLPHDVVKSEKSIQLEQIEEKNVVKNRISKTIRHQLRVLPKPLHMFFLFVLAEMLSILAWLTIEPGFVFYFYDDLLLSPTDFGLFVAAFGIISFLGQFLLGNISDKVGRKPVMIVGQMFSFMFYYLLLEARSLEELMIAVIFVGIGSGLRDPALKAWLSDVTADEHRATVFGIESGFIGSSQIIGPVIGGYLAVIQGIEFVFYIAIGINIVNILLLSTLYFNTESKTDIPQPSKIIAPILGGN